MYSILLRYIELCVHNYLYLNKNTFYQVLVENLLYVHIDI